MPVTHSGMHDFTCAACGARQKVYLGDPDDITGVDVEGVRCYKCGVVETIEDPDVLEIRYGEEYRTTPVIIEDGIPLVNKMEGR